MPWKDKEKRKEYNKNYLQKNRDKLLKYQKDYREKHKEELSKQKKIYTALHTEHKKFYDKKYRKLNREKIRIRAKKAILLKLHTNVEFRILHNLRRRLLTVLKRNKKLNCTIQLVGCSLEELKQHLESQFKEGMSWNNYGRGWGNKGMKEWHVDHITPCAKFDLSKADEQKKCFHYSNLQPLWAKDNFSKNKY